MPEVRRKTSEQVRNHQRIKLIFFVLASSAVFFLLWQIFHPFLLLLATSGVVAVVVRPFHDLITRVFHQHKRVSAFFVTVLVFLLLGLPLIFGALYLLQEFSLIASLMKSRAFIDPRIFSSPYFSLLPSDVRTIIESLDVTYVVSLIGKVAMENIADILSNTTRFFLLAFLFFFSLYYFLAERDAIYRKLLAMSPLSDRIDTHFVKRLTGTIRTVVAGNVVVGFIQALCAAVGFIIFGVPGVAIWATLTFFAAQVPMLGTGLVMVPASVYLLLLGNAPGALGLLLWGLALVGTVDNFIKPYFIGGRQKMHALLVLLSMLGGLEVFGPVGFILGPAVLAAALAFLEMYEEGILGGKIRL